PRRRQDDVSRVSQDHAQAHQTRARKMRALLRLHHASRLQPERHRASPRRRPRSAPLNILVADMKFTRSGILTVILAITAGFAQAQVPPQIEAGLLKIGQVVDPGCTARLYRSMMPANDINSSATPLYPGI